MNEMPLIVFIPELWFFALFAHICPSIHVRINNVCPEQIIHRALCGQMLHTHNPAGVE